MLRNRPLEISEAGRTFFSMAEAIGMLCTALASPALVAKLLQLSKESRARVWNFLSCHTEAEETAQLEWLYRFCDALREWPVDPLSISCNMTTGGKTFYCDHPFFVKSPKLPSSEIALGRMKRIQASHATPLVEVACSRIVDDNFMPFVCWVLVDDVDLLAQRQWYFVGRALALRFDRTAVACSERLYKRRYILRPDDESLLFPEKVAT